MSNALFNFELVTPEKVLMSDSVSSVSVSGVEGDMTVLANHSPIAVSYTHLTLPTNREV